MKPGYKTSEFLAVLATVATVLSSSAKGLLPGTAGVIVSAVLVGFYTALRTYLKSSSPSSSSTDPGEPA